MTPDELYDWLLTMRRAGNQTVSGDDFYAEAPVDDAVQLLSHLEADGRVRIWGGGHVWYIDLIDRNDSDEMPACRA